MTFSAQQEDPEESFVAGLKRFWNEFKKAMKEGV